MLKYINKFVLIMLSLVITNFVITQVSLAQVSERVMVASYGQAVGYIDQEDLRRADEFARIITSPEVFLTIMIIFSLLVVIVVYIIGSALIGISLLGG